MERGRSVYNFNLNGDVNKALEVVNGYIQGNGFTLINDQNESYYRSGDAMRGYRYFNYRLVGNNLEISAWLKGLTGEFSLEKGGMSMPIMSYRNSINELLQALTNLNTNVMPENNMTLNQNNIVNNQNAVYQNQGNNQQTGYPQNNANLNQVAQNFQNENIKKQETLCEIGFWLSIFGLFAAMLGVYYGAIVIILNFYFAYQGLNTSKRSKAIASILMSIASIVLMLLSLFTS